MNPENEKTLATIPRKAFLKARMLDLEGQAIATGVVSFADGVDALFRPDTQTIDGTRIAQQTSSVELDKGQLLKVARVYLCQSSACRDFHIEL